MYQILQYITFLFKATNQHGVHSPFVYDLVTKCFYDTTNYDAYSQLKNYRTSLLKNQESINITDFGAGSRLNVSNTRNVNAICKTSGTPLHRAKLLYRLVRYFKPSSVLELGTSLGIATQAMSLGNPSANITSVEGCPNISGFAKQQLLDFDLKNITIQNGAFSEVLPTLHTDAWDMVFFDGHHNKTATLNYFEDLVEKTHNDSVFLFDDIHWSKEMTEAWEVIKAHPKTTVTIDTFYWGLVFFREEQPKEHFKIRV
uniref:O-methyltransferase n=1 Tax=Gelidibacter sp. TaxID=2018083 RepID=UPI004049B739